jgi:cell division protein FtsQ
MNNFLATTQIVLIFSLLLLSINYVDSKNKIKYCVLEEINIIETKDNFLDKDIIKDIINKNDFFIDSMSLNDFNADRLEKKLNDNPFILDAEVFSNQEGSVNVQIRQREAIVRIMTDNKNYYLDINGFEIPVSSHYTPRVFVVTGDVDKNNHKSIIDFITIIRVDAFWDSQITQLHCVNNEFVLVPIVGEHKIHFGELNDIQQKLNNLYNFYVNGIVLKGWQNYTDINIKYNNQIVCTRNN